MAWMQKLYETYEHCANQLPPISHTTQQAHIEIVINDKGQFRRATVLSKEESTTLIPCTEKSGGRTSGRVNHPLCDKLKYVAGDFLDYGGKTTGHATYLSDLDTWASSSHGHPKLDAILTYVRKGQVITELVEQGILYTDGHTLLKNWSRDKEDKPPIFKVIIGNQEDAFVRWRVESPDDLLSAVWEDRDLINAWIAHYAELQSKRGVCMVTGDETVLVEQYPAKIRHPGDKAKLISSNDTSGYTFRGRFLDAGEACGVGYDVTQKAHNALRWLVKRQGYRNGDQVIVAWAVSGKDIPDPFANSLELFSIDSQRDQPPTVHQGDAGQAFGNRLSRLIAGYQSELGSTADIVVMGLDSASTGRMAITFYRELAGAEFLDRVKAWHESYAWHQNYAKDKKFVGAPSPRDIAEAAFGRRLDDNLRKATVERLLPCIIDGRPLPRDLMESTVRRTCNRAGQEHWEWEKNLGIACALFKGYFKERSYQMTLETNRTSRDYLYGRLLAIADHIESRALYIGGEKRDTNAARLMQRFADRPCSTWQTIELALKPYETRLHAKCPPFLRKMKMLLDDVISSFEGDDFMNDHKLSGEFLLAYHCQRRELTSQKKDGHVADTDTDAEKESTTN